MDMVQASRSKIELLSRNIFPPFSPSFTFFPSSSYPLSPSLSRLKYSLHSYPYSLITCNCLNQCYTLHKLINITIWLVSLSLSLILDSHLSPFPPFSSPSTFFVFFSYFLALFCKKETVFQEVFHPMDPSPSCSEDEMGRRMEREREGGRGRKRKRKRERMETFQ